MIARRPLLLLVACCAAATALGLVLGQGRTVALAAALVLVAAIAAAAALELQPAPRRPPTPRVRDDELPSRLSQIVDVLRESEHSAFSVDRSLRPLLVPIVTARLGRRGIDMALAPGRAEELLGDRLWEIVRPDRAATRRGGRGLARDDLQAAIERLEEL
ncbi:MAG TPA: hypothetical protein VFQ28_09365 [Gaiella sp.]|nr:hypothetical protein [Gaiella sp.]